MRMQISAIATAMVVASPALAIESFEATPNPAAISPQAVAQLSAVQPVKLASGSRNGLSWTAVSRVIGQTATSDVLAPSNTIGGGNPIYKPTANKSGTVALIMEYANGSAFICSGSLLAGGRSIATAAHCVSDGAGTANPVKTTVHFFNGDADQRSVGVGNTSETRTVTAYFVHPEYSGQVIDQNDIAILRINTEAPASAIRHDLYTDNDLNGQTFNVAGYGTRSTVGGAAGNTAPAGARTGFLREGDNRYEYTWGEGIFGGFFTDLDGAGENFFFNPNVNSNVADYEFSIVSDFDNGLAAQDQAFRICAAVAGPAACASFSNTGLGDREVGIAGGDSGGPGFINGKLATINSYGLTFGAGFGDFGGGLNSGWGEYSGYVPVNIHGDFIASTAVPEPASWAMLIIGFGLTGAAARRRRGAAVAA